MSNSFFRFKRFTVNQSACAMKVGTDGVLLGAWAPGATRILDIGTGTGVVALMMAQRFDNALVTAVEIDDDACDQASDNFVNSPFADRLTLVRSSVQEMSLRKNYQHAFKAIVSNPPYFSNSLKNPDKKLATARHNDTLTLEDLFSAIEKLLSEDGLFTLILPFNYQSVMVDTAHDYGFYETSVCAVCTCKGKPIRRYITTLSRRYSECVRYERLVLQDANNGRLPQYQELMKDFYLW